MYRPVEAGSVDVASFGDLVGVGDGDDGRMSGAVVVKGRAAAWNRMLLATGYPGRPADIAERIRR